MKKTVNLIAGAAAALLLLSSCNLSRNLYSWYAYEDVSYRASKTRAEKDVEALVMTYQKMIARQEGLRRTVPPGIYAEYGFVLLKQNRTDEGIAMLEKEIELYPESRKYISRIIEQHRKR
ncbi:MAG: DUF4810 domain-containing protein [Porphyromonas sp.]|nr:DUF4810 domain-containing protein [Porphyromonas sp.]